MLLVPSAFALGAVLAYTVTFWQLPATENPGAWGTFGDFLGGLLNPLVSTLTLFVAASVWKLQRKELELTREELEQTKLAMEEQAKTAEQQRQEQRFFDLLNVYQQTVESVSYAKRKSEDIYKSNGKNAISLWLRYADALDLNREAQRAASKPLSEFKTAWNHNDASGFFGHYFRLIHHILSEAEALLSDQHLRYIELFRAQLSRSALIILGFNLWLNEDAKNMIPLFEKYGLLKHLPQGHLRTELEKLHPKVFDSNAFAPAALLLTGP
jgi:hypothetical protein